MDRFTRAELTELLAETEGPCVTITLPTHRAGAETQQGPIRLRNLLRDAEERLAATGLRTTEARDRLAGVEAFINDSEFWRHQGDGLALFVGPDGGTRSFRVPLALDEAVFVGSRFVVTPLLPLVAIDGRFYILALSQNQVRLLHGTRHRVAETDVPDLPASLADALKFDDVERQLQQHQSGMGGTTARGGSGGAIFHGHGVVEDAEDERLLRFCQAIDRALLAHLGDERAPLVLAAVESLMATYRSASHYAHVEPEGIPGSPDRVSDAALHEAAWRIVEPRFRQALEAELERLGAALGNGGASVVLADVLRAAHEGRVETLFLADGADVWGTYDAATGDVAYADGPGPEAEVLTDLAAARTTGAGGVVYLVAPDRLPDGAAAAALLRY